MVGEAVTVGKKILLERGEKKNYNNVQVIFIRVETEKKTEKERKKT